jgi:DNA-binding response OmpR family regulator
LAIDDNVDTTEALRDYCNMQGISCKVVNEGRQGLVEIQKKEFDLILLDIAMPDYSGFDILDQLKKQAVRHETIVVLTDWNLKEEHFKDYTDVGVKEILKKPIGVDSLDDIVKTYLINNKQVSPDNILSFINTFL